MNDRNFSNILLVAIAGLIATACSTAVPPGSPSPSHPSRAPSSTLLPTPTNTSSPSPAATPISTPVPQLSRAGPWLLLLADDTLFALDKDGVAVASVRHPELSEWAPDFEASPRGGFVALKNSHGGLYLVHLPEMSLAQIAELLPPEREYTQEDIDRLHLWLGDTYAATLYMPNLAWSDNGTKLAFVSAMNGISPDLYLYSVADPAIVRLTSAPTFAIFPSWSPDSRYILHDAANQLWDGYSGRGHWIAGVWLAPVDGSRPKLLFESRFASEKGFENRHGWLSETRYAASSESAWCPATDLRIVSTEDGDQSPIWQGSFFDASLDPATATFLILIPDDSYPWTYEECAPHEAPALYILSLSDRSTQSLGLFNPSGLNYPTVRWSEEAQLFFVDTDQGLLAVSRAGDLMPIHPDLGFPAVSPDGQLWALPHASGEGLWLAGAHTSPYPIFNGEVGPVTWAPDGSALFFLGQSDWRLDTSTLYIARPPDFAPRLVLEDIPLEARTGITPFAWVNP